MSVLNNLGVITIKWELPHWETKKKKDIKTKRKNMLQVILAFVCKCMHVDNLDVALKHTVCVLM